MGRVGRIVRIFSIFEPAASDMESAGMVYLHCFKKAKVARREKGTLSGKDCRTMSHPQLRVYTGPEHDTTDEPVTADHRHTVRLCWAEILPILADAIRCRRTWLRDFEDDEVTISSDLYEVLMAYQQFRRPSA
jgi:hypothetical protein